MAKSAGLAIRLLLQDKEAGGHELDAILSYISDFFQQNGFIKKQEQEGKCSYRKEIRTNGINGESNTNLGYTVNVEYLIHRHSDRKSSIKLTPGTFSMCKALFPYNPVERQMEVITKLSRELTDKFELQEVYKCLDESYAITT